MSHKAKEITTKLLTSLGVHDFSITLTEEENRIVVGVITKEGALIGEEGEVVRALNTLLKRMLERGADADSGRNVTIDINGYERGKQEILIHQVRAIAKRVIENGHEIEMPQMNSYERMIVHGALKDTLGVRTESRGVGVERRVFICPEKS